MGNCTTNIMIVDAIHSSSVERNMFRKCAVVNKLFCSIKAGDITAITFCGVTSGLELVISYFITIQ